MGCHTWFYKKIKTPPFEDMKKLVVDTYQRSIDSINYWIDNPDCDEYREMKEAYPEWTIEYITRWRDADLRKLRMINKGLSKQAVINKYCTYIDEILIQYNGNFYQQVDEFHDLFRKYGYPDDKLFSLIDTLNYINNPENKCDVYEDTVKWLVEFWTKYPDGMIDFG